MPSAPEPAGIDVGNPGGEWLFKQGDMLLGPVPAKTLVDKLFRGEIDAGTPIAPSGEDTFVPIEQVEFFKVHAKKAQVKVRLDRATEAKSAAQGRQRNKRVIGFVGVGTVVLILGAWGATYLAINKPWRNNSANELEVAINVEAPTIAIATPGEDDVDLPTATPGGTKPGTVPSNATHRPHHPHPAGSGAGAPTPSAADPDGLSTAQFDQSAIQGVVNAQTKSLYPCIKAEAAREPGKGGRIPMEFTVGNDGRVNKLWIDNPDYKAGPLYECMFKTLKTWPFKSYQGEQANVSLNFSFGPKT